jgi:hypothetical protein
MLPAGLEPAVPASQRPQNLTLDRAATGDRRESFIRYVNWLFAS